MQDNTPIEDGYGDDDIPPVDLPQKDKYYDMIFVQPK